MADPQTCAERASVGAIAERLAQACRQRHRGETLFRHRQPGAWRPGSSARRCAGQGKGEVSLAALYRNGGAADLPLLQTLSPLPETVGELRRVGQTLGASEDSVVVGQAATKARLLATPLHDYRVLHFATHGLVAGDLSGLQEPALVLSLPPGPGKAEDALLTASEVATLRLNADWAVLSACNTASGDKVGADALSGLARAFFFAGTRALLVSHWAVNSEAAVSLTTRTFGFLAQAPQLRRAEAFQQAMLMLIAEGYPPSYWAPFVMSGRAARFCGSAANRPGRKPLQDAQSPPGSALFCAGLEGSAPDASADIIASVRSAAAQAPAIAEPRCNARFRRQKSSAFAILPLCGPASATSRIRMETFCRCPKRKRKMKHERIFRLPVQIFGLLLIAAPACAQDAESARWRPRRHRRRKRQRQRGRTGRGPQRRQNGRWAGRRRRLPNVFINGKPAVRVGDRTACGGVAVGGASNVFVNGKPLARSGDLTSGCASK